MDRLLTVLKLISRLSVRRACFVVMVCGGMLISTPALAHPLSYTDAWAKLEDDRLNMRVNVFLDDILRYQIGWDVQQSRLPTTTVATAVDRFGETLRQLMSIRTDRGTVLEFAVTEAPVWTESAPFTDVAAAANRKLTWKLSAQLPRSDTAPRALVFYHRLTPPGVEDIGELRLHLQDRRNRRRVDAVIPAERLHTLVLPARAADGDEDVNQLKARLIVTPRVTTIEWESPLLLLQHVFDPEVQQRLSRNDNPLSAAEQQQVISAAEDWFRRMSFLQLGDRTLTFRQAAVHFLPLLADESTESAVGQPADQSPAADRPPSVIRLGVRLHFDGISSAEFRSSQESLRLQLRQKPGHLQNAQVALITPFASESRSVLLTDKTPSLNVVWDAEAIQVEAASAKPLSSAQAEAGLSELPAETPLVNLRTERPGRRGLLCALAIGLVTLAVAVAARGRGRVAAIICGLLLSAACVWWLPETSAQANRDQIVRTTAGMLDRIYRVLNDQPGEDAVRLLSSVMEADLLEQVYVSASAALPVDARQPTVVSVADVRLTDLQVTAVRPEQIRTNCHWNVAGTVFHWGHLHRRQASLTADLTLTWACGRWQLSQFQLTAPVQIQSEKISGERS